MLTTSSRIVTILFKILRTIILNILIVLYSSGIDIFRVSHQSSKKVERLPFILMMLTLPMKKPAMIMELLNRPMFKLIRLKIRIVYYLNIPTIYTNNNWLANNHLCISQLNDFISLQLSFSYQITLLSPNWHELWKQEKYSSSTPTRGMSYT